MARNKPYINYLCIASGRVLQYDAARVWSENIYIRLSVVVLLAASLLGSGVFPPDRQYLYRDSKQRESDTSSLNFLKKKSR